MLKKAKPAKQGNKNGQEDRIEEKENKNHYYSTMTNLANNQIPIDDGEVELKPDIHQTIGSKKLQEEFETIIRDLTTKVVSLNDQVIEVNRDLNKRNNYLVKDITGIIHEVLHDSQEVNEDLKNLKKASQQL